MKRIPIALVALLMAGSCTVALAQVSVTSDAPAAAVASATISPEKRAEINRMLEITHALDIGRQYSEAVVAQMTDMLRTGNPQAPARAFEVIPEEINAVVAENMGGITESLVVVYDRYFTLEELRALNAFYGTELGAKLIAALPGLTQDSMAAGEQWGASLGPQFVERLDARFTKEKIDLGGGN